MKKVLYIIVIGLSCSLIACTGGADKKEAPTAKQEKTTTQTAGKRAMANPADLPVQTYVDNVSNTGMVDLVFYSGFGSATTDFSNEGQIKAFTNFLDWNNAFADDPKCKHDGGAVFRSTEGEILMEMDYTLKPDCRHARVRIDGKYYYPTITEAGFGFLNQFTQVFSNPQGQPKAK